MQREIDFIDVITKLSKQLPNVEYSNGDLSDVGNEVGYQLGNIISNMTDEEIDTFITGLRHGISLTNGTH